MRGSNLGRLLQCLMSVQNIETCPLGRIQLLQELSFSTIDKIPVRSKQEALIVESPAQTKQQATFHALNTLCILVLM